MGSLGNSTHQHKLDIGSRTMWEPPTQRIHTIQLRLLVSLNSLVSCTLFMYSWINWTGRIAIRQILSLKRSQSTAGNFFAFCRTKTNLLVAHEWWCYTIVLHTSSTPNRRSKKTVRNNIAHTACNSVSYLYSYM